VARNVTERRRMDEESARLAAIVQSSEDAIVSKTLDGTIRRGTKRRSGYTALFKCSATPEDDPVVHLVYTHGSARRALQIIGKHSDHFRHLWEREAQAFNSSVSFSNKSESGTSVGAGIAIAAVAGGNAAAPNHVAGTISNRLHSTNHNSVVI
jgi:hypothetical protein